MYVNLRFKDSKFAVAIRKEVERLEVFDPNFNGADIKVRENQDFTEAYSRDKILEAVLCQIVRDVIESDKYA